MRLTRRLVGLAAITAVAASLTAAAPASAASLQRVNSFGNNPSNLNMYVYVPDNVDPNPALLVAVHYCTGTAQAYFSGMAADFVAGANKYGYVVVFPEATRSGQCFDVYTPQALKRDGGSDPVSIRSMVSYAQQQYKVDPARIYATGASSGAMMVNVLLANYPDVFAAGSAFMGVPFTCFATNGSGNWNSQCSGGQINKTPQQWGDAVRASYPGYTGKYPRFQAWHGSTDTTLSYPNFNEELEQWTNVHGLTMTPALTDRPQGSWTRTRYGSSGVDAPVEGISVQGVGHNLPQAGMVNYAISFLGLDT